MLSATLFGNEAACDFEHLYTMPLLQLLGMPLSLVSLTGIVAGPTATLLLLIVGWASDGGSNPHRRKIIAMAFNCTLLILGMVCILVASMLHLQALTAIEKSPGNYSTGFSTIADETVSLAFNSSTVQQSADETGDITSYAAWAGHNSSAPEDNKVDNDDGSVPFKAMLGFLGFVLLDLSYDCISSSTKSFILNCSSRSHHTSLLVVGLIMAAAGGVSTAALGVVDFTTLLGLSSIEGAGLAVQTSIQGAFVILMVVLCTTITILCGQRQRSRLQADNSALQVLIKPDAERDQRTSTNDIISDIEQSFSHMTFKGAGLDIDQTSVIVEERERREQEDDQEEEEEACTSETQPLLPEIPPLLDDDKRNASRPFGAYESNGSTDKTTLVSRDSFKGTNPESPRKDRAKKTSSGLCGPERSFKANLALLCVSTYFNIGVVFLYTLTSSDFIGKAVFGGDPQAAPGSEKLMNYQSGVRMASWGFLVYYCTYVLFSMVHSRVLSFLGFKAEVLLINLLEAASMVILATTARLEAYFMVTVVAGVHRTCIFVVPFAVANDIIQHEAEISRGGSSQRLGLAMSVVTATMPLGYCTLYPWVGPVEEATGLVSVPLFLCATCACLSAFTFVFIKIAKR
nr:hypothetical protein BaRGS_015962 [Batillaria attramentaria]